MASKKYNFEDTKGVMRCSKSKYQQYKGQNKTGQIMLCSLSPEHTIFLILHLMKQQRHGLRWHQSVLC